LCEGETTNGGHGRAKTNTGEVTFWGSKRPEQISGCLGEIPPEGAPINKAFHARGKNANCEGGKLSINPGRPVFWRNEQFQPMFVCPK
jgi:hypothetical protein